MAVYLGIDERDQNITGAGRGGQSLVQVCQSTREHHGIAHFVGRDSAIVADIPDTASLIVASFLVQGNVDAEIDRLE